MQSVKVVITGPFDAGKTTFIRSVSEITVLSTERRVTDTGEGDGETTVAMDFGRITISDDVVLYLFGTPGQSRFSFIWETLSEGMLGFVLVVDALRPQTYGDAREMIRFFHERSDIPYVVAANRLDSAESRLVQETRRELDLPDSVSLLPLDARDRESVKSVLLALLREILARLE